ncbi:MULTISPECIES: transposase [unclassified Streptomyces]|uniref:transposase n=1 Tax=unclassified Streptomyces TaxID=2593676 RepID=UPI0029A4F4A7|nr:MULTISPECIES: transposase [unclassified Streptomyces]MDX3772123.1 transposase [Streptomyces sp. AK08-01B]MDX3821650.1 transposase [Streptomyces sp. AK08-01A]
MDTLALDLLDPEEARRPPMAMEGYSDEFKADAVTLYESVPGATYELVCDCG